MVNDKLSLYDQKPMGSGVADAARASFANQYSMGNANLAAVAARTEALNDRRGVNNTVMPEQPRPLAQSQVIDRSQITAVVQGIIGAMTPNLTANIYRELERSFG